MSVLEVTDYTSLAALDPATLTDGQTVVVTDSLISGTGNVRNVTSHGITSDKGMVVKIDNDWYWERSALQVYIEYFGASPAASDNSGAIQDALNYASNNNIEFVYAGAGEFTCLSTIYFYYDATNNPDFNTSRNGRIGLIGQGNHSISDLRGSTTNEYGSIFTFTSSTGHGFLVSNQDTAPFPQRKVTIKDLTVITDSTDGFGIYIKSCPIGLVENVSIRVNTSTGSAIRFTTSWFGTIVGLFTIVKNGVTAASGSVGLQVGSPLFGGLFKVKDSMIDGFYNNVIDDSSDTFFSPITFENTAFQRSVADSIYLQSAVDVYFEQCYHENNQGSTLKMTNGGATLSIHGGYISGGSDVAAFTTDPLIDLDKVKLYDISRLNINRPWQSFLKVSNTGTGSMLGKVSHVYFRAYDNAPNLTSQIYMFETAGNQELPTIEDIETSGFSNPYIDLYDKSTDLLTGSLNGVQYQAKTGYGEITRISPTTGTYWAAMTPKFPQFLIATNTANQAFYLPDPANIDPGRTAVFANSSSSTGFYNLRDHNNNILVVANPGEAYRFTADPDGGSWIFEQLTLTGI